MSLSIFLGVAEAGLYPGVAYYLTMWYDPRYLTLVGYCLFLLHQQVIDKILLATRNILQCCITCWCLLWSPSLCYRKDEWYWSLCRLAMDVRFG